MFSTKSSKDLIVMGSDILKLNSLKVVPVCESTNKQSQDKVRIRNLLHRWNGPSNSTVVAYHSVTSILIPVLKMSLFFHLRTKKKYPARFLKAPILLPSKLKKYLCPHYVFVIGTPIPRNEFQS